MSGSALRAHDSSTVRPSVTLGGSRTGFLGGAATVTCPAWVTAVLSMPSRRVASVADTVKSYGPFTGRETVQENLHGASVQLTGVCCWSFMLRLTVLGAESRGASLVTLPLIVTEGVVRAALALGESRLMTAWAKAAGGGATVSTATTTAAADPKRRARRPFMPSSCLSPTYP